MTYSAAWVNGIVAILARGAKCERYGGANLRGANLGADLGADLIDAGQDSRGYRFVGWLHEGVVQIRAGCRNFTLDEGRKHWANRHGPTLRAECLAKLDLIEAVAKARGWGGEKEQGA